QAFHELELFCKTEDRPRQTASPRRQRRVALLCARASVRAVRDIEETLVGDAPADIEAIAPSAVVHAVFGGGLRVLDQAFEKTHLGILLFSQCVAEHESKSQRSQRADGVDEQGVSAVKRVNEPAVADRRPPPRLHGAADLQRELIEVKLPLAREYASLAREPPEIAVGADDVEAVIVDAHVGEVRRHAIARARASQLQEFAIPRSVELQHRRAELKALGPLGPPTCLIATLDGEYGRTAPGLPGLFDRPDFPG